MPHPRITEVMPNPKGIDKNNEWVELCADTPTSLEEYSLKIGTRSLNLTGSLDQGACAVARTGTLAVRNREAEISLLYRGSMIQAIRTAGTAPETYGFHVTTSSFWAPATPGNATGVVPYFPPLPDLSPSSVLPGLIGTAACTAGILTALALAALRYARDRHYALQGRDAADSC